MEILRGVERRRRWDWADKLRIVAEADAPGAVFAAVARRHDVSRGQLWNWRPQVRSDSAETARLSTSEFLPICLASEATIAAPLDRPVSKRKQSPSTPDPSASGRMEITLPNGAQIRVDGTVDAALLKAAIVAAHR
jgi:transposase